MQQERTQGNMDNVIIFLRGKSYRQQAVELNDHLGELNSPEGEVNSPTGELNPPTGEQNYGTGEVCPPAQKLNSPAGEVNSPLGELNPLAGEQNYGAGEVDFLTEKLNRAAGGTQFPRDWTKIICAEFKTSPPIIPSQSGLIPNSTLASPEQDEICSYNRIK